MTLIKPLWSWTVLICSFNHICTLLLHCYSLAWQWVWFPVQERSVEGGSWEVVPWFWVSSSRKPISGPWGCKLWNGKGDARSGGSLGDWVSPIDHYGGEAKAWMHNAFPGLPTCPVTCQSVLRNAFQLVCATWCVGHCGLPLYLSSIWLGLDFSFEWQTHLYSYLTLQC